MAPRQLATGHDLPIVRGPMVGRDAELAELLEWLRQGGETLVTLTGPGGVGKTRLAIETVTRVEGEFADGAAFVGLADVREPSLVAGEVGRALDLAMDPGTDPGDSVVAALRHRAMLLVLDNFEQVSAAALLVVALTSRCPKLAVLVTSRRRLGILGERVMEVAPLEVPGPASARDPSPVDFPANASVDLFCQRAGALNDSFEPDQATVEAVGEICRRLDGLPLAIEPVAAHTRHLPAQALLSRLAADDGSGALDLLQDPATGDGSRHRDLSSAIQFSCDLLDDDSRRLLWRLSVFDGGWSLDALDAVCGADRPGALLDALSELNDLHLVEPTTGPDGAPRFRLLATVRHAAREELRRSGEVRSIADRHADFFAALAVEAGRGMEGRQARRWLAAVDCELGNVRAALDHLMSAGRHADALVATSALGPYWLVRGPAMEGLRRLESCLQHCDPSEDANGEAWAGLLSFEVFEGGSPTGPGKDPVVRIDRARIELSASGDHWAHLRATSHLAYALRSRGELTRAEEVAAAGLERCSSADTLWWRAELLNQQALAWRGRDQAKAMLLADRAIEAARAAGHERCVARATFARLLLDMDRGLADVRALEELHDLCEEVGNRRVQALVAMAAGAIATRGRHPSAGRWYLRAIDIGRETGYDRATWWAASGLVIVSASTRPADAARLHGALSARSGELLAISSPDHRDAYDAALSSLRRSLGAAELTRLVQAGEDLAWEEAMDTARELAVDLAGAARPPAILARRRRGPRANPELTDRELQILAQLVRGHTNQGVADELGISAKTVMHHTTSVYRKLGVRGRAEAVAHALRSGLVHH